MGRWDALRYKKYIKYNVFKKMTVPLSEKIIPHIREKGNLPAGRQAKVGGKRDKGRGPFVPIAIGIAMPSAGVLRMS